tara:strand:+ start:16663 stop:17565 length:903 start_codon:yes stop_codon:yes gene_type:complete
MNKIKSSLKNLRDFFFEDNLSKFLSKYISSNLCVDIGAAKFEHIQWKTFLLSNHTKWIAVDPNKADLKYLDTWRWNAKLDIEPIALSKNGGLMDFYSTNVPTGSSLKKINIDESMKNRIDEKYFFPVKKTKIKTLSAKDLLKKYWIPEMDIFIKIDIQGYGLDILESLEELIKKNIVLGIEIESSLYAKPVYENSSKFSEISHFLEQFGYELINLNVINLKKNTNKKNYLPNECDSVFSLQQHKLKYKNLSSKINQLCFYNCYKMYDEMLNTYNDNQDIQELFNEANEKKKFENLLKRKI